MVEGLKGDLTKLEPILEQASKDAEKLLKQVEIDKADAAKVKEKVRGCVSLRVEQQCRVVCFGVEKSAFDQQDRCTPSDRNRIGSNLLQAAGYRVTNQMM